MFATCRHFGVGFHPSNSPRGFMASMGVIELGCGVKELDIFVSIIIRSVTINDGSPFDWRILGFLTGLRLSVAHIIT